MHFSVAGSVFALIWLKSVSSFLSYFKEKKHLYSKARKEKLELYPNMSSKVGYPDFIYMSDYVLIIFTSCGIHILQSLRCDIRNCCSIGICFSVMYSIFNLMADTWDELCSFDFFGSRAVSFPSLSVVLFQSNSVSAAFFVSEFSESVFLQEAPEQRGSDRRLWLKKSALISTFWVQIQDEAPSY